MPRHGSSIEDGLLAGEANVTRPASPQLSTQPLPAEGCNEYADEFKESSSSGSHLVAKCVSHIQNRPRLSTDRDEECMCPSGHSLKLIQVDSGHTCDVCGDILSNGQSAFQCAEGCGFTSCQECDSTWKGNASRCTTGTCIYAATWLLYLVLVGPMVVLAQPWCCCTMCMFCCCGDDETGSRVECVAVIGLAFLMGVNFALILMALHLTETIEDFTPWEAAAIGWVASLVILIIGNSVHTRKAYVRNGSEAAEAADDDYDKLLLGVFGVHAVRDIGEAGVWVYPLVATMPAVVAFFLAQWLLAEVETVVCNLPASACCNHTDTTTGAVDRFLSNDKTHCCVATPREFSMSVFVGQTAGNVFISFMLIRYVARFLINRSGVQLDYTNMGSSYRTNWGRKRNKAWRPSAEPARSAFGSLRFDGVVPHEAQKLKKALAERGVTLEIIDMKAGGDIDAHVFAAIEHCSTFIVFGSANYGEDTGNQACTYYEYKHAFSFKKNIILIRMIPFDQEYEHQQARVAFRSNLLVLDWQLATQLRDDVPQSIARAMEINE